MTEMFQSSKCLSEQKTVRKASFTCVLVVRMVDYRTQAWQLYACHRGHSSSKDSIHGKIVVDV